MKNAQHLVATVQALDIKLTATDDNVLIVNAPKGQLTAELRHVLTQNKQEIISFLRTHKNNYQNWYQTVNTIASRYELTVRDLREFDAEAIDDFKDNEEAIIAICQSLTDVNYQPRKRLSPSANDAPPLSNLVRCIDCQFFERDAIGSGAGIGHCKVGKIPAYPEMPFYPYAERFCELIVLNNEGASNDI